MRILPAVGSALPDFCVYMFEASQRREKGELLEAPPGTGSGLDLIGRGGAQMLRPLGQKTSTAVGHGVEPKGLGPRRSVRVRSPVMEMR